MIISCLISHNFVPLLIPKCVSNEQKSPSALEIGISAHLGSLIEIPALILRNPSDRFDDGL